MHSVTEEIVRLAEYAAKVDPDSLKLDPVTVTTLPSDAAGYHYKVEVHLPKEEALDKTIDIPGAIWDPAVYVPFTQEVLAKLHLDQPKPESPINGDPLALLINPRVEVIQAENRRISQWLTEHPLDTAAHEQAALVIGTLGMRENAGSFWDPRGFCNHASAHLALARALNPTYAQGDCGAVAELLIGLLIDTKADCQNRIEALAGRVSSVPALEPWVIVGKLRNTRDYRVARSLEKSTLLERIELFRAVAESQGTGAACKKLETSLQEPLADWTRILLQFSFTVDQGHQFTQAALPFEFGEMGKVFPEILQSKANPDSLKKALNVEPGHMAFVKADGSSSVNVIDDGAWAMFFQRHLCHIVESTHYFLEKVWGVPDDVATFKTSTCAAFQKLTLFPFVSLLTSDQAWAKSELPAILEVIKAHPEFVTDSAWAHVPGSKQSALANGTIRMQDWFKPGVPAGTAYCYYSRVKSLPSVDNPTDAGVKKYYAIAPWHFGIAKKYLAVQTGGHPTPEKFKEILGRYLEFYHPAMEEYAELVENNPSEYAAIMGHMAEGDPDRYIQLGKYLVKHGKEKEAVEAFENAFSHQADAVSLSNDCEWLVNYYLDHQRTDRALEIAKFAAEVYSGGGLTTMASLMERLGKPEEAESYYLKIQERYNDTTGLTAFYARQRVKAPNSEFAAKLTEMERKVFPDKMKSIAVSDFSGAPQHGVLIPTSNATLRHAGLKVQDVIVALDGKQVDNFQQYAFVRGLTTSEEMDFVIYRDGKYQAMHAKVSHRRFGIDMDDYHP